MRLRVLAIKSDLEDELNKDACLNKMHILWFGCQVDGEVVCHRKVLRRWISRVRRDQGLL